ncbi:MAG: RDD family protein [Bacilli bacterium]|jgi:uncharacterized RDD family membrane protein YckC
MAKTNPLYSKHPNVDIIAAPFGRRLLAMIIDLLISLVIAFLSYAAIEGIYYNSKAGRNVNTTFYEVKKSSFLYSWNDEKEKTFEYENYLQQEVVVKKFYTESKYNGENVFIYENATFYNTSVDFDYDIFILKVKVEDSIYELNEENNAVLKEGVEEARQKEFWQKTYVEAVNNFLRMPIYRKANKPFRDMLFYGSWGAFVIGSLIPILIIPLIFGNGLTIGKHLCGLCLCDVKGFRVRPINVIVRYLVYSIAEVGGSLRLFFIPLFLTSATVTLNKQNKAAHDLAANTYVCDARASKIFKNAEDQQKYHKIMNNPHRDLDEKVPEFFQLTKQKRPKAK